MTVSLLIATVLFAMQDSVLQAESSLVLYDESAIPPHYKPFKHFTFGNHSVTIKQNWAEQGVAGVVWDAVSIAAGGFMLPVVLIVLVFTAVKQEI